MLRNYFTHHIIHLLITLAVFSAFFMAQPITAQPILSGDTPPRTVTGETSAIEQQLPNSIGFPKSASPLDTQLSITIIESRSVNPGHSQDTEWLNLVTDMGHSGTIVEQSILDDTSFFSTTDILIIASGIADIPANRVDTIASYLQQGGQVYLQAEYQMSYGGKSDISDIGQFARRKFLVVGHGQRRPQSDECIRQFIHHTEHCTLAKLFLVRLCRKR